jgi:5'-phosphate synthase pdxT subunit
MTVGVLALQGNFAEHIQVLQTLGVPSREVRSVEDLTDVTHLIIPGGESTVMARFLKLFGIGGIIQQRVADGSLAVYGTCAGCILVAAEATGKNAPETLGLLDITVARNAYGPQTESFERTLTIRGWPEPVHTSFIRAPIIVRTGEGIEVLAEEAGKPVLVRKGRVLAGTFHPEVRGQTAVHAFFLRM